MQNLQNVFSFAHFPILGEMGDNTNLEIKEMCDSCHRKEFIYHHLSYRFDKWNGEDIIKGADFYLVSERVKNGFVEKDIKGMSFVGIENEKSRHFKIGKKAYQKELPKFYKIEILNKLDGPEIWYKRKNVCPVCKDQKWGITVEGISSLVRSDEGEFTPRSVYKESWKGEEIFLLQDPGPPIVTEGLVHTVEKITGQKLELKPATWV